MLDTSSCSATVEPLPLVWMGAAATTLRQLDAVQLRALTIISRESWLPSLALRHAVAAHTYLYKLQCLPTSSPLRAMIPAVAPELQEHPRTNQQRRICHELQFAMPRNRHSRNSVQQSFPSAIVEDWNRLPPPLTPPRLQQLKEGVHKYLRSADWHWASIVRGPIS